MKNLLLFAVVFFSFSSCELLEGDDDSGPDIAAGLKEALRVGTEVASEGLAATDGYLADAAVKILLPDEIQTQINNFKSTNFDLLVGDFTGEDIFNTGIPLLGINSLADIEDELITGINRAAESAASEAAPIFFDAITGITIQDANNILFGGVNDAATTYLKDNTFDALFDTYEPKINTAISSVTVGDQTVEALYNDFVSGYNDILSTTVNPLNGQTLADVGGLTALPTTDLSEFATGKGLDGLFIKVAEEEEKIRLDPLARINDILQDVFGLLDE